MPNFSQSSKEKLGTCNQKLQDICNVAIERIDFTIVEGHRDKEDQDAYYEEGHSGLKWPNSKHNYNPSRAVDVAPWIPGFGIDWNDYSQFYLLQGILLGIAHEKGIKVRFGGSWNNDLIVRNNKGKLNDLPHLELENEE